MALSVIPFLLGKHLTNVTLQALAQDAYGNLTVADTQAVTGLVVDFDFDPTVGTDDIRGVNMNQANAVPQDYDATLNLTILLRSDANAALIDAWTYDQFAITVQAGALQISFYGTETTLPIRIDSRGKNTYRISFKQFVPMLNGVLQAPVTVTN